MVNGKYKKNLEEMTKNTLTESYFKEINNEINLIKNRGYDPHYVFKEDGFVQYHYGGSRPEFSTTSYHGSDKPSIRLTEQCETFILQQMNLKKEALLVESDFGNFLLKYGEKQVKEHGGTVMSGRHYFIDFIQIGKTLTKGGLK